MDDWQPTEAEMADMSALEGVIQQNIALSEQLARARELARTAILRADALETAGWAVVQSIQLDSYKAEIPDYRETFDAIAAWHAVASR